VGKSNKQVYLIRTSLRHCVHENMTDSRRRVRDVRPLWHKLMSSIQHNGTSVVQKSKYSVAKYKTGLDLLELKLTTVRADDGIPGGGAIPGEGAGELLVGCDGLLGGDEGGNMVVGTSGLGAGARGVEAGACWGGGGSGGV
jgi:hypothetical protein